MTLEKYDEKEFTRTQKKKHSHIQYSVQRKKTADVNFGVALQQVVRGEKTQCRT